MSLDSPAADTPAEADGLSRRRLMRQAAAAGAAGLAVSLVAGSGAADAATTAGEPRAADAADAAPVPATEHAEHAEPMIVHLRDARTGRLDLFSGERHHQVQDPALAAALVRALG